MIQSRDERREQMDEEALSGMSMGYFINRTCGYISDYNNGKPDDWILDFYQRHVIPIRESGK